MILIDGLGRLDKIQVALANSIKCGIKLVNCKSTLRIGVNDMPQVSAYINKQ